jgi:hypothetical protein
MPDRPWDETRTARLLDWVEAHTPGGRWPWGHIWLGRGPLRGWSFHFASGVGGFAIGFPLPRWLPGFVRSYQIGGPRSAWACQPCPWWRESDLNAILPLLPPGWPHAMRTRRLSRPRRDSRRHQHRIVRERLDPANVESRRP